MKETDHNPFGSRASTVPTEGRRRRKSQQRKQTVRVSAGTSTLTIKRMAHGKINAALCRNVSGIALRVRFGQESVQEWLKIIRCNTWNDSSPSVCTART